MPPSKRAKASPLMLRGSLIALKRKCGKPSCHCAQGEPHETPALSYSIAGKTKILTLRDQDIAQVEAGLARYRSALATLEKKALAGITTLRQRIERDRTAQRGRKR